MNEKYEVFKMWLDDIKVMKNINKELENKKPSRGENLLSAIINAKKAGDSELLEKLNKERRHTDIEIAKIDDDIYRNNIRIAVIKQNAKNQLFYALKEELNNVLKPYIGKPYGEKTRAKINYELMEKLNVSIDIRENELKVYCAAVKFTTDFDFYAGYKAGTEEKFLVNNKIQNIDVDGLVMYYTSATEIVNVFNAVTDILSTRKAYVEAVNAARAIADHYNEIKTDYLPDVEYIHAVGENVFYKY